MKAEEVQAALGLLKQVEADRAETRNKMMEDHLDHGDRAIAQLAQLKLLGPSSAPVTAMQILAEVAQSKNPL